MAQASNSESEGLFMIEQFFLTGGNNSLLIFNLQSSICNELLLFPRILFRELFRTVGRIRARRGAAGEIRESRIVNKTVKVQVVGDHGNSVADENRIGVER